MEPDGCWPGHTYRMEGEVDMWAASGNGSLPPDGQHQLRPKKKTTKTHTKIFCSCVLSKSAFLWNKLITHKGKKKSTNSYLRVKENTLQKICDLGFQKYSRKNRHLQNLNRKWNESQCYIAFKCDVNVTILKPKVYFFKNVLFNIPVS